MGQREGSEAIASEQQGAERTLEDGWCACCETDWPDGPRTEPDDSNPGQRIWVCPGCDHEEPGAPPLERQTPHPRSVRIDLGDGVDLAEGLEQGRAFALDFRDNFPERALKGRREGVVYRAGDLAAHVYWTGGNTIVVRVWVWSKEVEP